MRKKKIVIQTNGPQVKTGLAENGKNLALYLHKTGKYEIIYYCTQTSVVDPVLQMMPWKAYGAIPNDPMIINQLNQDPNRARDVSYGSFYIDEIIKNEKPDALILSDDIWSFPLATYAQKKWAKFLNVIYHITVDSLPILNQAYEQAESTKYFFTWANFGSKEMKKAGSKFSHVKSIYGMVNTKDFSPIPETAKNELRKRFNINPKTIIIGKLGRNQLRKEYGSLLLAFSEYKKENPNSDIKLHFHTSFSEKGNGWDIERLIKYYGINPQDILCTYICKNCGEWTIEPYRGEDLDCPKCGAQKSRVTANIINGVPNEEMKFVYGIWDAGINLHTSGGQELNCCNTLLCGLPLGCTNYASGEDFCEQSFVSPINFEKRFEAGTTFIKSTNSIKSIKNFIDKIYRMTPARKLEIGRQGYEWAVKTFSVENIGKKWEEILDNIPNLDWNNFSFENDLKDSNYPMPNTPDNEEFIDLLYKNVLKMNEPKTGSGFDNWRKQLANGVPREQVYQFFIKTALEENAKNKQINFKDLLDFNGKKRALFVIKESLGDNLIVSQLFEDFHVKYPNTDLYVACDPKFFEVHEGNPLIHKLLPYQQFMESEMVCIGAGQNESDALFHYYFHPGIQTQRQLNYLSQL